MGFVKNSNQVEALNLIKEKTHTLLFGGSRSGKSAILVYTVFTRAIKEPNSRHLILRYRFNSAKTSLIYDTIPKILALAYPGLPYTLSKVDWFFKLPNGSEVWVGGLDDGDRAERILGREYATIWFEECSELDWKSVNIAKTRLAQLTGLKNRLFYSCNPPNKRHWTYKVFIEGIDPVSGTKIPNWENDYGVMRMNPEGNAHNLSADYMSLLSSLTEKERKRFLLGEFTDDSEGSLFKYEHIAKNRVHRIPDNLIRVGVGVDPAVSCNESSDTTGIIVGGMLQSKEDGRKHFYIWDDCSIKASPSVWATEVDMAYKKHQADFVVAEINQGGDMVVSTLHNINPMMNVQIVRATRGKAVRAEPVAALCEKGQIHIVGELPELENEMTSWNPLTDDKSPDHLDAFVWLVTELMGKNRRIGTW